MGTVVFPDAQVKFFIEADAAVRVERRIAQLADSSGASHDELRQQMLKEIVERDARDASRAVAPTKPAPDSVIIDNSTAPLEQVLTQMGDMVRLKVKATPM
jgi:cytidylate kinase